MGTLGRVSYSQELAIGFIKSVSVRETSGSSKLECVNCEFAPQINLWHLKLNTCLIEYQIVLDYETVCEYQEMFYV